MSELIVAEFEKNKYPASDVLHALRQRDVERVIDLEDAVAVYRNYDGTLHVEESSGVTASEGAAWGALSGSFIGAILAIPFAVGASVGAVVSMLAFGALIGIALGATAGAIDASWSREDASVDSAFVREVSTPLQPGDSAIFALISESYPDLVAEQFKGYGGKVRRSSLTPLQGAELERYLRDRSAA